MESAQTNRPTETTEETQNEPAESADFERLFDGFERLFDGLRELATRRHLPAAYRKRFCATLRELETAFAPLDGEPPPPKRSMRTAARPK